MKSENLTETDEDEVILINMIEEVVRIKVGSFIETYDMCCCMKCQLNACAIALNALDSRYVTTTKGALLTKLSLYNSDIQTAIDIEVLKALNTVRENPRH